MRPQPLIAVRDVETTNREIVSKYRAMAAGEAEIAYQTAFALNLALQVAAWIWFMFPRARIDLRQKRTREPCSNFGSGRR